MEPITQNSIPEPVQPINQATTKPIKVNNFLVLLLSILLLIAVATAGLFYFRIQKLSKELSKYQIQPSPTPSTTPNPTADWKLYQGEYFSFKYPQAWADNTGSAASYPNNLEVIGLRISPNAIFEASYKNYNYERGIQNLAGRKSSELTVSNREATRFEMAGNGDVLPPSSSIISFVVKGTGDTSYYIVFNGDRKDITDELINQILSTFKFLDQEIIPAISAEELSRGWYWGSSSQKKPGTPSDWVHSNEGTRSASWHKPGITTTFAPD